MDVSIETIRAFCEIDRAIDESFLKLSDKLQNLTLSHNRKKEALCKVLNIARYIGLPSVIDICEKALFCDGRERMKPFKKKGGRPCV